MKYFFFAILISFTGYSQVGIGTINPSPASMLDINSTLDNGATYKGLMPPKIPLTTDLTKINAGITDVGLMVFVQETGCLKIWNGVAWENIRCISVSTGSEVEYNVISQSLAENAGSIDFNFTIDNPSTTNDILLTIVANSYTDLVESTSQMVVIPAGNTTYVASSVFNIIDDLMIEGDEQILFTITTITGGNGTSSIGANNTHTLTIVDNDGIILGLPFQESFETDGNGVRYTTSIVEMIDGADYFSRGEEDGFLNVQFNGVQDGTYLFAAQDIDGLPNASSPEQTLLISGIDITGGINLQFDVLLAEDDQGTLNQHWDGNDFVHIDYQIDGAGYQNLLWIESQNGSNNEPSIDNDFDGIGDGAAITSTWNNFTRNIPLTGATLDLRITIRLDAGNEDIGIDNIRVTSN